MWAPPGTIGPTPQMPGVGVIPAQSLNVVMEMPIFVIVCSSGTGFPLCTEDSLSQIYSPSQNTALVQVASASQQLSTLLPLVSSLFLHLCPHLFLFLCLLLSPYPFGSFSLASLVAQVVKKSTCNEGDLGSIPGLGRSPRGGHGNPLQSSCLENPHGQRSLVGYSHGVTKSQTQLSN